MLRCTCSSLHAKFWVARKACSGRLNDLPSLLTSQLRSFTWHLSRSTNRPLSFPFNRFPNQALFLQDLSLSRNNKITSASGDCMVLLPWHVSALTSWCSDKIASGSRLKQPFRARSWLGCSEAVLWFKPISVLIWQECREDQRVKSYNYLVS